MKFEKHSIHDLLGTWTLLWAYGPILLALASFGAVKSVWTYLLAFAIVGGRMHAVSILAHETWHGTLFRSRRANERIGAFLLSFPVGSRFAPMREKHFEHHRTVGTLQDPDRYYWGWKLSDRPEFVGQVLLSMTGLRYIVHALRALLGIWPQPRSPEERPRSPVYSVNVSAKWELLAILWVQLLILASFAATLGWVWYFALWILPLISLAFVLGEVRQFLEHARGGRLMVYRAGPLERFFLGCFNFHLHGFHHAFASEPWFRLPHLEAAACRKEPGILFSSSYLRELLQYLRGRGEYLPDEPRISERTSSHCEAAK